MRQLDEAWIRGEREVAELTDGLNHPVDGGIRPLVTALRALGLPTIGSCEGHVDHGYPFPWVQFQHGPVEEPGGATSTVRYDMRPVKSLNQLIYEFSAGRRVAPGLAVLWVLVWTNGFSRLQSVGGQERGIRAPKEEEEFLAASRKEMESFARFLWVRFFRGGAGRHIEIDA